MEKRAVRLFILIALLAAVIVMPGALGMGQAEAEEKELAAGVTYLIGDKITLPHPVYLYNMDDSNNRVYIEQGTYTVPRPDFGSMQWQFMRIFLKRSIHRNDYAHLWLGASSGANGDVAPIGIKCISGNGHDSAPYVFELVYNTTAPFKVAVAPGAGMFKTEDSGARVQSGITGAMTDVIYNATSDHYFPTNYPTQNVNGITVTRISSSQIRISGTPTSDTAVTLRNASQKWRESPPFAVESENCTTAENNDGKLNHVTTEMEYQKYGDSVWTSVTADGTVTGLTPGYYFVRAKAKETTLPSDYVIRHIERFVSAKVTFKVVNGAWDDNTTADRTVVLSGPESKIPKLSADQIPAAGSLPASDYKTGSWDVTPTADAIITEDTTFTYSYAHKDSISQEVTFRVVGGRWDDIEGSQTRADRVVTVTALEGEPLRLSSNQIPLVGNSPDEHWKAGHWDVTPTTFQELTGPMTYTYTYTPKVRISTTVTFRVENGSWDDGTTADKEVPVTWYEGETPNLTADQIPAAGSQPAADYKTGSWDAEPTVDTIITGDRTFTYSYAHMDSITRTVTFRVEGGAWDDIEGAQARADRVVTLSGLEGNDLRLTANQIPLAGNSPDMDRKTGVWLVTPSTDTVITDDTTYTYVYIPKVRISTTVTFKVVGGAWNDGTTADREVELHWLEGDTPKLSPDQIPEAGSQPASEYKTGSWDVTPTVHTIISRGTTYTYSYAHMDSISQTVTFRVIGGAWDDIEGAQTRADRVVTLTGLEGNDLRLTANQIPLVGGTPDSAFKAGSWDVTPNTDTIITGPTAYTYTYAPKDGISATVTFKVKNGAWNDGSTEDRTVVLTGLEGDTLNLSADQIPAAGSQPAGEYKAGSWDVTPTASRIIKEDTTYTYTYAHRESVSQTVTFRVVNGAWDDAEDRDARADRTVTLTGLAGDPLKLAANQIPAAGGTPDADYKAGVWDVTPNTDTVITGATTYTYTYVPKQGISAAVTFRVKNGSWNDGTDVDKTVVLTGLEGDTPKLSADQIPAVGSQPANGCRAGSWDVTPNTDRAIAGATTYTYTYAPMDGVSAAVTFRVKNGTWDDGTTEDITVMLTGLEGDTLNLSTVLIPAAGSQPAEGYRAGSWDVTPTANLIITGDTVFTYTYAHQDSVSQIVTFRVAGGAWDDAEGEEARADRTVMLTGMAGEELRLASNQIPAVGGTPDASSKAGSWDIIPNTDTVITGPTTYTYTYAPKDGISATVTFRVKNGTWNDGTAEDRTVVLTGLEGDTPNLSADQIPAVGSQPASEYRAGSWDVTPTVNLIIRSDTTFTYSYAHQDSISQTVTFRVDGGAWDDAEGSEARADRTVTLNGMPGEELELAPNQIPAVGGTPDASSKAGSWDIVPNTDTAITGPTTYTYTYAPKDGISATVTFRVVGGAWNDGTTADRKVFLNGLEGDTPNLRAELIPSAGSQPAEGYRAGSWDVTPTAYLIITEDTTFTYTYAYEQPDSVSRTVTFRVVNGAWDDAEGSGARADRTVTLTGAAGDTLRLSARQIPRVGNTPDRFYRAGSWNVTPDTDTAITQDTVYTYTYQNDSFRYDIIGVSTALHVIGDGKDAVITVRRSVRDDVTFDRFAGVTVDGTPVTAANYSAAKGSLILTLKAAYLDTLKEGMHAVRISFTDGSVDTSLKIEDGLPETAEIPKTGDTSAPYLWLALVLLGLLGLCAYVRDRRSVNRGK